MRGGRKLSELNADHYMNCDIIGYEGVDISDRCVHCGLVSLVFVCYYSIITSILRPTLILCRTFCDRRILLHVFFVVLVLFAGSSPNVDTHRFKCYCQKIRDTILSGSSMESMITQNDLTLASVGLCDSGLLETVYNYLDYPYECMIGSVFLLYCDSCARCYIGSSIFCPRCSEDGKPVRLMKSCQATNCWANNSYFEAHKSEFMVMSDVYKVCPHTRCKADNGIRIHSVLESVLSIAFSDFFPILVDTSRSELSLHLIHCHNTEQLYWGYSYAMASILYHMGEFSLGSYICNGLKEVPSMHKDGFVFNPDFKSYFEPHQVELQYRKGRPQNDTENNTTEASDQQYLDKDDTIRTERMKLFNSELKMAAPHALVLDALKTIYEEETKLPSDNAPNKRRPLNPPYDSGDNYDGPFLFHEHKESQLDKVLEEVHMKSLELYNSLLISDPTPQSKQAEEEEQFSFQHPGRDTEVEDAFLFFSLHSDGKPATPFGAITDYNVILLRLLNANGSLINTPGFTHPICILPKNGKPPKRSQPRKKDMENNGNGMEMENNGNGMEMENNENKEGTTDGEWIKNLSKIIQAILYDVSVLGVYGVYIKRKDPKQAGSMKWYHLRWSVVHFSGDTVAEEEVIGYPGKKSSSFPCIYDLLCKNDIYSPDRMTYRDKANKGANKRDLSCPLHALRSFPITSAAAHLGFIAGLPPDSSLDSFATKYPFIPNFLTEASQVQFFLHQFYGKGTFFWTPTTPHHPVLRQLLDTTLINQCIGSKKKSRKKNNANIKFSITTERIPDKAKKKLAIVDAVSISLEGIPSGRGTSDIGNLQNDSLCMATDTIMNNAHTSCLPVSIRINSGRHFRNFASINRYPIMLSNHPCIGQCGGDNELVLDYLGSPDKLDIRGSLILLSNSILIPWDCLLAVDDMHMGSNLIYRCQELLTGRRCDLQHIKTFADSVAAVYHFMPDDVITNIPILSSDEMCIRLQKLNEFVQSPILGKISGMNGNITSFPIHDKTVYGNCYMEDVFQESRFDSLIVFSVLEVINIFGVLRLFHMGWTKLASIGSLLIFYLSCVEGKVIPSATCPSFHRLVHIPDKILQNGPLFYATNYYCEQYYGIVAKNLSASANIITTCIKKLSTLTSASLFIGPDYSVHVKDCKVNGQFMCSIKPRVYEYKTLIAYITRANVYDDYGFARYLFLNRETCLDQIDKCVESLSDNCNQGAVDLSPLLNSVSVTVKAYCDHNPKDYSPSITFGDSFNVYTECLWRDGHVYTGCDPFAEGVLSLTCSYLCKHSNSLAFMTNYQGELEVYLVCGFIICEVRTLPYVQAFCIRLPVQCDNPCYSSYQRRILLGSSLLNMDIRNGRYWRLISLYRLHLQETKTILVTRNLLKLRMESLHVFQCNAISSAYELLPDGKGDGRFDVVFDRDCISVMKNPKPDVRFRDKYRYKDEYDLSNRIPGYIKKK